MIAWKKILNHSDVLASKKEVAKSIQNCAINISDKYHNKNPIILCLMNGGLFFTAKLCEHLHFPLRIDYLHATRYRGNTTGSDLQWVKSPQFNLANEHILLLDDVYDEGVTLKEVTSALGAQNPASLACAVLVDKQHQRKPLGFSVEYSAITLPDRYLFGCGMDYLGHWRHLPQIYAVHDNFEDE